LGGGGKTHGRGEISHRGPEHDCGDDPCDFLWLSLDLAQGQEYWAAMELMGRYAAANHACIHQHVAENLGAQVLLDLENHHNFAW
jgi:hypothetical protein